MTDRPFDHLIADIPPGLAGAAAREAADDAARAAVRHPAADGATETALAALLDSVEALEASGLPQNACTSALMLVLARALAAQPHTIDEDALVALANAARELAALPEAGREARLRALARGYPPMSDE